MKVSIPPSEYIIAGGRRIAAMATISHSDSINRIRANREAAVQKSVLGQGNPSVLSLMKPTGSGSAISNIQVMRRYVIRVG
ncbi:MAG: hypothetical protein A3K03_03085 [Bdellovibrionales bacterium RIFOXYD1_FULL_44_7]|nr:MAG: hypothetical protein A3K03_03085 [Bdellovibrionales bacterium RIFOXYD1_FULL_44_7]